MSENFVLQNPLPEEIEDDSTEYSDDSHPQVGKGQTQLQLEKSLLDKGQAHAIDIRNRLSKREDEIEFTPFWKNMATSFATVTAMFTVLGLFISGLAIFNRVAPTIPFYYNGAESRWEQADKTILLISPIVLFLIETVLLRLIYEIILIDKRLSLTLGWILTLLNLLIIIASIQIYTLIT